MLWLKLILPIIMIKILRLFVLINFRMFVSTKYYNWNSLQYLSYQSDRRAMFIYLFKLAK